MLDQTSGLPEDFEELVRDALLHLYDPASLQSHPLAAASGMAQASPLARTKLLRQALLDAIEALQPNGGPISGAGPASRAWRAYRILELRYIEGREVSDVIEAVVLSKSQYHREHRRALLAVATLLWQRWGLDERWASVRQIAEQADEEAVTRLDEPPEALRRTEAAVGTVDPLSELVGVVKLLEPMCRSNGKDLTLDCPESLPPIRGDRVTIRQGLLSVLAHSLRAAREGRIEISARTAGGQVEIQVTGPSAEHRLTERDFEESHQFVRALRGSLGYHSADDGPWSVRLTFPTSIDPLLLVVDNEPGFIDLVERYMVGRRWAVVGVSDIDQAFIAAQSQRPQAILLDMVIPGRDGWDLLLQLKSTPATADIPVIVCSVLDEPEVAVSLGAAAYLQKPISQSQIDEALAPYHLI